jgi:uroporphyrinogen decarboxylase
VDILNPVLIRTAGMDPRKLKAQYGDRLVFHGCISIAGPGAYGTVEETVEYVQETLEVMIRGGGYALSPTHMLQDNSPTENVVAMYEAAHEYGRYRWGKRGSGTRS